MSVATASHAQQANAEEGAAADSRLHFERGVQLYREGSFDAALAEFTRAHELTHDFRLLYNIGQVQAERHDYARAIEVLTEYLRLGSAAMSRDRRAEIELDVARLRQRVAELWITTNVPSGDIYVGDHLAAKLPLQAAILVNAGPVVVRIQSPGYETATKEIDVAGGDRPRIEMPLEAEAQGQGVASAPEPVYDRTPLWVGLSVTGACVLTSTIFALIASGANSDLDDELTTYPPNETRIDDARSSVKTNAIVSDLFAGAAIAAAGASLYFYLNPREETPTVTTPDSPGPTARLVPSLDGLWLEGTF